MEKQRWEESDGKAEVGRVREEKVREEKRREEKRRDETRREEKKREDQRREREEKESEERVKERRCRCAKRKKGLDFLCFSGDLWLRKVEKKAGAEPFGQMSCQKSAPRCGTKHISKSK